MLADAMIAQPTLGIGQSAPSVTAPAAGGGAQAPAEEFEAFFLGQMLSYMFAGVDDDPLFGSHGERVFQSLLVQEYGKVMARAGGVGIADAVQRELLRQQEVK